MNSKRYFTGDYEKYYQVNINSENEVLKQYSNIAKVINVIIEQNEKTKIKNHKK